MEGEGRKAGVKKYDYFLYTKDVTAVYDKGSKWNEEQINSRTKAITNDVLKTW
ncbi:MAG: hypothetical protein IKI75_01560 [Lachnospiraceae bacterium]|nr:hypothetical protein [Lachnospiraceae bacterium]